MDNLPLLPREFDCVGRASAFSIPNSKYLIASINDVLVASQGRASTVSLIIRNVFLKRDIMGMCVIASDTIYTFRASRNYNIWAKGQNLIKIDFSNIAASNYC